MATKPRSQVNADYFSRLKQLGYKKISIWIPPEAQEAIARLKSNGFTSQDAAVSHSVCAAAERGDKPEEVAEPEPEQERRQAAR